MNPHIIKEETEHNKMILPLLFLSPLILKTNLKHFNNLILENLLLPNKFSIILLLFLFSSTFIYSLTEHSHLTLFLFKSYPLYSQPFSHNDTFS